MACTTPFTVVSIHLVFFSSSTAATLSQTNSHSVFSFYGRLLTPALSAGPRCYKIWEGGVIVHFYWGNSSHRRYLVTARNATIGNWCFLCGRFPSYITGGIERMNSSGVFNSFSQFSLTSLTHSLTSWRKGAIEYGVSWREGVLSQETQQLVVGIELSWLEPVVSCECYTIKFITTMSTWIYY
jgi:hypothetical protein